MYPNPGNAPADAPRDAPTQRSPWAPDASADPEATAVIVPPGTPAPADSDATVAWTAAPAEATQVLEPGRADDDAESDDAESDDAAADDTGAVDLLSRRDDTAAEDPPASSPLVGEAAPDETADDTLDETAASDEDGPEVDVAPPFDDEVLAQEDALDPADTETELAGDDAMGAAVAEPGVDTETVDAEAIDTETVEAEADDGEADDGDGPQANGQQVDTAAVALADWADAQDAEPAAEPDGHEPAATDTAVTDATMTETPTTDAATTLADWADGEAPDDAVAPADTAPAPADTAGDAAEIVAAVAAPAGTAASAPLRPGDLAETRIAVWAADDAGAFRVRLREAANQFVDNPTGAVTAVAAVVTEAVDALAGALQRQHADLVPRQLSEHPDTESLRVAIRRYREFLDRLLAL